MKKILIPSVFIILALITIRTFYAAENISIKVQPKISQSSKNLVYSYAAAVKKAQPAVVNVHTKTVITENVRIFNDPIFDYFFGKNFQLPAQKHTQTNLGSGVIVSKKGYVVTNYHVIKEADKIKISLNDGRTTDATLIGADIDTDLAILKINLTNLPEMKFANSEYLEVGDVSLAIGNPFGVGQTVTMGIISATGRNQLGISNLENFIQTDAAINPGNSGGALVNARGELIGINTAIFSKSGASHGIGFAIPSMIVKSVLENIVNYGTIQRGWLGVKLQDLTPSLAKSFDAQGLQGVIISGVYRDSPAFRFGIKPGDILTKLNGVAISNKNQWKNMILQFKPKQKIKISLFRQGSFINKTIPLGTKP